MLGRKIVVFSNLNGKNEVIENCQYQNWGQLKEYLIEKGIWSDNVEPVVKGTRVTLNLDEAELPSTEFTLYLIAKKMKSGGARTFDELTDLEYDDLKTICKYFGLKTDGEESNLRRRCRDKQRSLGRKFSAAELDIILDRKAKTSEVISEAKCQEDAKEITEDAIDETAVKKAEETYEEELEEQEEENTVDVLDALNEIFETASKKVMTEGVKNALEEAKGSVLELVSKLQQATSEKEVVDVFEGLAEEWKEIKDELDAK